jgi:hypothetical protein
MPPDPQEWALAQSRQPGLSALRGPDGDRGLMPPGDTTPAVGGDRRGFFARLTAAGTGGQYAFKEVQQSPGLPGTWVDVPGGVTGPSTGPGGAWEPGGNAGLAVGATGGAIVLLVPSAGDYGQDYVISPGPPSSVAVFHASGPTHSTGIVPDPGSTAGTAKFLREDATWAVPAGGGGSAFSGARLVGNATPTFANGTLTDVTWLLDFDSGGYTSGVSPYTTFSLAGGSTYLIGVDLIWNETATNGWRHVEIQDRNGAVIAQADEQLTATPGTCGLSCSTLYRPSLTGNIKVRASQTSGTNNRTVNANASFWVNKVG